MTRTAIVKRASAALALAAASALVLSSCAGTPAADGEGSADAASATSLADFGTLADLEAAAKAEGALNVIALPRDWANYGEILDLFAERYPEIAITEQSPDVSSAEEIQAAETNAGLDTAPDVFDLGLTVALQSTDQFAPYQVETWDDIPDALKESTGLFVGDYGGYMSIGYDSSKFDGPAALDDLLDADYKGIGRDQRRPDPGGRGLRGRRSRDGAVERHARRLHPGHRLLRASSTPPATC